MGDVLPLSAARNTDRVADASETAALEVVLSRREPIADRCRALRRLGLTPEAPLRVIAVSTVPGRDPAAATIALMAQKRLTRSAHVGVVGGVVAVLFQQGTASPSGVLRAALRQCNRGKRVATGIRVGVGGLIGGPDAEISWDQALLALRFTCPRDKSGEIGDPGYTVVDYDSLGVLTTLAEVSPARLQREPDVMALDALAATENGALDVCALEAFCLTGSLRQAAQVLYLHHSTVASRLERVEKAMDWQLADPAHRFKAQFALLARRLAHAAT
jgi:sugar diacid utilization regulator